MIYFIYVKKKWYKDDLTAVNTLLYSLNYPQKFCQTTL